MAFNLRDTVVNAITERIAKVVAFHWLHETEKQIKETNDAIVDIVTKDGLTEEQLKTELTALREKLSRLRNLEDILTLKPFEEIGIYQIAASLGFNKEFVEIESYKIARDKYDELSQPKFATGGVVGTESPKLAIMPMDTCCSSTSVISVGEAIAQNIAESIKNKGMTI